MQAKSIFFIRNSRVCHKCLACWSVLPTSPKGLGLQANENKELETQESQHKMLGVCDYRVLQI